MKKLKGSGLSAFIQNEVILDQKRLAILDPYHTMYGMKMTMHIDEVLLERVIAAYDFESKTEAVDMALREMDRKVRYREFVKNGLGFTPEELGDAVEPGYDPKALRVAETPKDYGC
ncbi:MAG: type II toxin-antitoxin system VapB family antitoxin [Akkermansiaceae bacterium]|nr:type II toxin-antitoxin system VapB family antitoxin [Akkermansiaceae bacterium]MDP4646816.1 type II toxin-antitoxin system VapB family antitoxin [Akkermansiaceae bacterium]MDP4719984.1 type II toxin-antitoxin system VapB family antitoxin [Akkermansiaceae bacterium]MDP4779732.1 type II toxin-antitoxin system VapB family antitoxin [Akkermansiaceae bacterium]MDP4846607.1 type II toxin-antitoxin system VapB family antitoxin [Akkermansiaceae bacterium]